MTKPVWTEAQWYEVHYRFGSDNQEKRIDRRRRSKEACERIAAEMRETGNYTEVWLVEVNRLTRDRGAVGGNPRTCRRG